MIVVYCKHITPRILYTVKTLFNDILNIKDIYLTSNISEFENNSCIKINYSRNYIKNTFTIIPNELLNENTINKKSKATFYDINNEIKAPFISENNCNMGFDVFSAIFFVISRYEEYITNIKDIHNRYPAQESILYKHSLLNIPVINIWAEHLLHKLNDFYNCKLSNQSNYKVIFSFDVDIAYAYKHKSTSRNLFSLLKKVLTFKFQLFIEHLRVLSDKKHDPYDTYDYFLNMLNKKNIDVILFFLLGNPSAQNINLSYTNKPFRDLIKKLAESYTIGIHPSYYTADNYILLKEEISRLENIIAKQVNISRQHYLKFNLPATYRHLINNGITEDYSMAYASHPGFRAGTCSAFNWFDLEKNTETNLKIYPTSLMDGTLNEHMHLRIDEAIIESEKIINTIKKYKGCFIPLWHNNTLSETGIWNGWRKVFEAQIEKCL